MGKQLIVGAAGQLGIELMLALQERVGPEQVLLADIRPVPHPAAQRSTFVQLDATDEEALNSLLFEHDVDVMFMLVAMLSAKGCLGPQHEAPSFGA